ncbi:hypothetical protein GCU60_03960 [Blastococcus saxobsidens]|uniref:Glycoprotein n=1 Tax=Blastococcus saxobsidens TaxID=138336 RepID=A0A6L9W0D5_9ACTN|nr:hypothetical protein [Blastococcus saxobsidens]
MTRPAAARAGGRPAADASARTRAARRAAALVPLLAGTLALTAPPVLPAHAAPVLAAPSSPDDAVRADRPVRIDVARFEPRIVTPGSLITVTGTLTNTGPETITDLSVRLQRGVVRTNRAQLAEAVVDPDPATALLGPFATVPEELAPGATIPFTYSVPSDDLQLDRDGVYPTLLNVNGIVAGDEQRVGELSTFLVRQAEQPAARTAVAWLWPLSERTHRAPSGAFADDELAESISAGGRLDRALAVIERLPRNSGPGDAASTPSLPVTLAIDPALVEALALMAEGPYAVAGEEDAGTGTEAAVAYLDRLRALADSHPVVALPYGDVDADTLQTTGMQAVVTRSLPGSPEGTAQDPPGAPPEPALPTGDGEAPAAEPPRTTGAGAEILIEELDVTPATDLAWASDGSFEAATLDTLRDGGIDRVVLGGDALSDGWSAVGADGSDAVAHTTVPLGDRPLDVLVADPVLSAVVGAAEDVPGGPRMAEQRYLAELAALSQQTPPTAEPTVLVAPPRDVVAGVEGAGAMMADTVGLPWLRAETVEGLGNLPPAPAGELVVPPDEQRLDVAGTAALAEAVAIRNDLAGAVVGDAGVALQEHDAAIARSASVLWTGDPAAYLDSAEAVRTWMDRLRQRITVVAPADGTYTLASSDAPLVLTIDNALPFPVQVLLQVRTRGSRGLSIGDIGPQTLAPGQRTTLQVPTEVRRAGGFAVTAGVTTPSGSPLGQLVDMQVKSTAYGSISLSITIGAASLLGLLFLRRFVNLVRRRRAAAAAPAEGPVTGLPVPPTRSPV